MPPLTGIEVLDFSRFLPGPYCTWLLGDLGADIVRVEHPRELAKQDAVFGIAGQSAEARRRRRARDSFARNKRSIALDPGAAEHRDLLLDLVRGADILVEDYRPGVLAGMGLGYEALAAVNPRLIYASVTLCGQTGPYRDKPGHDPIALAIAGVLSRIGEDPEAPCFPGVPVADLLAGSNATIGILAALWSRERSGRGQHVDIAMSDAAMPLIAPMLARVADPGALPPRGRRRADSGLWRCADGRYVCTTDMEPRYWARFCAAIDAPDLAEARLDTGRRDEIRRRIAALMARKTSAEWMRIFDAHGTQAMPVHDVSAALDDPHNLARGMSLRLSTPDGDEVRQVGPPIRLGATPCSVRHVAGGPDDDRDAILARRAAAAGSRSDRDGA